MRKLCKPAVKLLPRIRKPMDEANLNLRSAQYVRSAHELGFIAIGGSGFTLTDSPVVPVMLPPQVWLD